MQTLEAAVAAAAAETAFSGVVRVDRAGEIELEAAYGLADRAHGIPNAIDTRFGTASITKGFTALVIMGLAERGVLELGRPARSLLGADLPLIAGDVTIEHLLEHRSGIGDYFDEALAPTMTDYAMPVPVHRLASTEDYLAVLDGHGTVFAAGEHFAYNNAGFVVLALLAERAAGRSFPELVKTLVTEPAGMGDTDFPRSDELPGRAAHGYLWRDGLRTNGLHLPVLGSGDGGCYSTAADLSAFWAALFGGRILPPERVAQLVRPRSDWPQESRRYGLGFHLHATHDGVFLEGSDAGVSCASLHRPSTGLTATVLSNWTDGAWPMVHVVTEHTEWGRQ